MTLQPLLRAVKTALAQLERMHDSLRKISAELESRSFACQVHKQAGQELMRRMQYSHAGQLHKIADLLASVAQAFGSHNTMDPVLQMPQVSSSQKCWYQLLDIYESVLHM